MTVTTKDVRRVARLARLSVSEDDLEPLAEDLSKIFAWIEQLNEVDIEGVEPMTSAVNVKPKLRKDKVTDGEIRDQILANAPRAEEGFFVVPKAVE